MAQGLADAVLLGLLAAAPELLAVAQRGADVAADPIVGSGLACGRYSRLTQEDLAATGADKSLTEGFVDFPLTVDGVEVSVSMMEVKKRLYKISLRSKGTVNVNAVASKFGGGGHILASGCMLSGELEEVIEKITYAVYQNL